eukprot:GEMP01019474.1.p1 GENE.GEMP01019474.1~~GEMP01019474.1.p1  ORF type:complete len:623 (+),score=123.39 GEMP01019474.1:169-2037(+)
MAESERTTASCGHDCNMEESTDAIARAINVDESDYQPTHAQVIGVPVGAVGAPAHIARASGGNKSAIDKNAHLVQAAHREHMHHRKQLDRDRRHVVPECIVVHSRKGINRHINGHYLLVQPRVYKKRCDIDTIFLFHRLGKWRFAPSVDSDVSHGYADSVVLLDSSANSAPILSPTSTRGAWQMCEGNGTFESDPCVRVSAVADSASSTMNNDVPLSLFEGAVVQTLANRNVDVARIAQHLHLNEAACRRILPHSNGSKAVELPRFGRTVLICFWIALSASFPRKKFTQSWYGWDEIRIYTIFRWNCAECVLDLPFFGFAPDDHRVSIREFDLLLPAEVDKILATKVLWASVLQPGLAPRIALLSDLARWMLLKQVEEEESVTNMVWFDMDVFQVAPADHFVRAVNGPDDVGIKVSTVTRPVNGSLHTRKILHLSVEEWHKVWRWDMNMSVIAYHVHSATARDLVARACDVFRKLHIVRNAETVKWCAGMGTLGHLLYDTFGINVEKVLFEPEECHPFPLQMRSRFVDFYATLTRTQIPLAISLSGSLKARVNVHRSKLGEPVYIEERQASVKDDDVQADIVVSSVGKGQIKKKHGKRTRRRAARRLDEEQAKRRRMVINLE